MPPLNTAGPIMLAGSTVGESIAIQLGLSPTAQITLNDAAVRAFAGIATGAIIMPTDFYGKGGGGGNQLGIFAYGVAAGSVRLNTRGLVSNTGVIAADVSGAGFARDGLAAATYGGDKGIFGYGTTAPPVTTPASATNRNMTNLLSNTGVLATDTAGVGTARYVLAALTYGGDKAIFGFGQVRTGPTSNTSLGMTNLVSNTGVVAGDTAAVGQVRGSLAGFSYGGDKGIFGYGIRQGPDTRLNTNNLVSNTGVVAANGVGVGSARSSLAGITYGGDKGIFAYGGNPPSLAFSAILNYVSNTGVISGDTTIAGISSRLRALSSPYGGDKSVVATGSAAPSAAFSTTQNLVSNVGIIASYTSTTASGKQNAATCGYG